MKWCHQINDGQSKETAFFHSSIKTTVVDVNNQIMYFTSQLQVAGSTVQGKVFIPCNSCMTNKLAPNRTDV